MTEKPSCDKEALMIYLLSKRYRREKSPIAHNPVSRSRQVSIETFFVYIAVYLSGKEEWH
ncbi:hypothetical protein Lac2_14120 [Claveliimonas bilis]|uniref:Uncharacterized protein n=1 Tax=Claveliimonas bilis TaxID=3028070 RepID=A0ABM8I572_9FIRM|nr:hypothetical protein Lac1_24390 [Claveliimonas bilis]BDZ80814.1 hypothetical protein Lac3_20230 [Claveliimonas bilis]BDZ83278.1 hypothetical protein Lac2_14120 [Claveliimonas bilis]